MGSKHIELTDASGKTYRCIVQPMVRGECGACELTIYESIYVESHIGAMRCPHCLRQIEWTWGLWTGNFMPEVPTGYQVAKRPGPKRGDHT